MPLMFELFCLDFKIKCLNGFDSYLYWIWMNMGWMDVKWIRINRLPYAVHYAFWFEFDVDTFISIYIEARINGKSNWIWFELPIRYCKYEMMHRIKDKMVCVWKSEWKWATSIGDAFISAECYCYYSASFVTSLPQFHTDIIIINRISYHTPNELNVWRHYYQANTVPFFFSIQSRSLIMKRSSEFPTVYMWYSRMPKMCVNRPKEWR